MSLRHFKMRIFLPENILHQNRELLIGSIEILNLLNKMPMDSAFDRSRADHNSGFSKHARDNAKHRASGTPDKHGAARFGAARGHHRQESFAMSKLMLQCFFQPRQDVRIVYSSAIDLRGINRHRAVLAGVVHTQYSANNSGIFPSHDMSVDAPTPS